MAIPPSCQAERVRATAFPCKPAYSPRGDVTATASPGCPTQLPLHMGEVMEAAATGRPTLLLMSVGGVKTAAD